MADPILVILKFLCQDLEFAAYRLKRDDFSSISNSAQFAGKLPAICSDIHNAVYFQLIEQIAEKKKFHNAIKFPMGQAQPLRNADQRK